jgi:hypothetical protein
MRIVAAQDGLRGSRNVIAARGRNLITESLARLRYIVASLRHLYYQIVDLPQYACEQQQVARMPKRKEIRSADQHREFVKAARELGTDESEEGFDKMLGKVAKAPPPKSVQKRKRRQTKKS